MSNHQFETLQWNSMDIKQIDDELTALIEEHKSKIIILQETFFCPQKAK